MGNSRHSHPWLDGINKNVKTGVQQARIPDASVARSTSHTTCLPVRDIFSSATISLPS
jgi:hypothetical protein